MKIYANQLESHINKIASSVYMVSGDEPLLHQEACQHIREYARENGCGEHLIFNGDKDFDWDQFNQAVYGMSLFAEKRLIELRLNETKPDNAGARALEEYIEHKHDDNVLLVLTAKLDANAWKKKWIKSVEKSGLVIQVYPIDTARMPAWIGQRMRHKGMRPTREVMQLLADRMEGNLLACAQEIEKLYLLYGERPFDEKAVLESVGLDARFDVYKLVDVALTGNARRTIKILESLRGEGVGPVLILWALTREIRLLQSIAKESEKSVPLDQAMVKHRVWDKRKPLLKSALGRVKFPQWLEMLRHAGRIECMIKGVSAGNLWDELLQLCLAMGGTRIVSR